MKPHVKIGDFVRSHFRACWTGVVVDVYERSKSRNGTDSPVITCVIVRDRRGNLMRHRQTRHLDLSWTTSCTPVDVSMYHPNWFAVNPKEAAK